MFQFIQFFTFQRMVMLFAASLVLFLVLTPTVGFAWSWFFLLIVIFLLIRYFLLGSVSAAAQKLQYQDIEGAEKMLSYTWKPQWLQFGMEAMYHFLKGTIATQRKEYAEAEKFMKKSLELGLPDNDSTVMAYMNLAGIAFQKNNKVVAKEYVDKALKLKPSTPMIVEQLKQMEQALKAPQNSNYQQFQQMINSRQGGRFRGR